MDYYNNNNNNNMDYHNAGYYQNNGSFSKQGGDDDVVGPYSKNGYNNNSYPQYSENHLEHSNNNYHPQYVNNNLPVNYNNNNYDGGGVHSDPRNGYNNTDPYYSNIKSTSPGGSAYGNDSGYNTPYPTSPIKNPSSPNMSGINPTYPPINPIPARQVPYDGRTTSPYSENAPKEMYSPSPIKNPGSPNTPGINPTYPPINPIPARQVPYDGRTTSPYSEDAPKEMYPMPSSNSGPTNHGQENPISPSSAYSKKPFLDDDDYDEKKHAKPGGLMKYCCCGGRVTCCKICAITCCILILLIIGIVAAVLLWARPPKVDFLGIAPSPNGLPPYSANPTGFDFNLGLKIQVDNPNIVGANFQMIKAIAFYPGHSDSIGGGNLTNVAIAAKANTTIDFPFSVNYNKDIDPGFAILFDIAQKCGLTGEPKQKLEIDYKLTVTLRVLLINVSPSFDKKAMIDCPIQDGKIPNIPGFDIGKVAKSFGKKKKRDLEIQKSPMALSK